MENGELRMENECDGLHGFILLYRIMKGIP